MSKDSHHDLRKVFEKHFPDAPEDKRARCVATLYNLWAFDPFRKLEAPQRHPNEERKLLEGAAGNLRRASEKLGKLDPQGTIALKAARAILQDKAAPFLPLNPNAEESAEGIARDLAGMLSILSEVAFQAVEQIPLIPDGEDVDYRESKLSDPLPRIIARACWLAMWRLTRKKPGRSTYQDRQTGSLLAFTGDVFDVFSISASADNALKEMKN